MAEHHVPQHERVSVRPGLHDEYVKTTGAILGGRNGWDQAIDGSRPYGGAWQRPILVLTHHPEDATPADGVTFLISSGRNLGGITQKRHRRPVT
jgi:hypothetical protein